MLTLQFTLLLIHLLRGYYCDTFIKAADARPNLNFRAKIFVRGSAFEYNGEVR